ILRQESTAAAGLARLLGSRATIDRVIAHENDEWSLRLTALASSGQWDGVAVIAEAPTRQVRVHNVSPAIALDDVVARAVSESSTSGTPIQLAARVLLADRRRPMASSWRLSARCTAS